MVRGARRADRTVILIVAVFDAVAAATTTADFGDGHVWLANLWPPVFAAAAILTFAFAARPRSTPLLSWSGALSSAAYLARAMVLVVAMQQGQLAVKRPRAVLSVAAWVAFAAVTRFVWLNVLKPATGDRRARPRS